MGRPPYWTADLKAAAQEAICTGIEQGHGLERICAADGLPSTSLVRVWLTEDEAFQAQYARAREVKAELYARQIMEIADSPVEPTGDGAVKGEMERRRQQIDARKWTASKLAPKVYGDRVQVDSDVTVRMSDDQLERRLAQLLGKTGAGAIAGRAPAPEGEEEIP
jgi:hypothetical protein